MILYAMQKYIISRDEWEHLPSIDPDPDREVVLARLKLWLKTRCGRSARAKNRQYRLAKFHYGGCRHVVNPRA